MSDAWKHIDLAGGGLQSANVRIAALLKRRGTAGALLCLYPLGLHRDYLGDRRGAWSYRGVTLIAAAAFLLGHTLPAGLLLAAQAAFAVRDLLRLDDTVAGLNKQLRMRVYLGQTAGAPADFAGHYTDEPPAAGGAAGHHPGPGRRTPSFAEQEKLLRELDASRRKPR